MFRKLFRRRAKDEAPEAEAEHPFPDATDGSEARTPIADDAAAAAQAIAPDASPSAERAGTALPSEEAEPMEASAELSPEDAAPTAEATDAPFAGADEPAAGAEPAAGDEAEPPALATSEADADADPAEPDAAPTPASAALCLQEPEVETPADAPAPLPADPVAAPPEPPALRPFAKLLIANRGEIAVRIARSARRMGIATVAVHSDADADALHVRACDEAVAIGPAPAAESYLDADRLIGAARATGAEAVHPGYGFLSENPDFAEAVEAAGLIWVGPPPEAIRAMGLKDAAKARMEAAGVAVVPGWHGTGETPEGLSRIAAEIGFPVLIKARAGGGGKGMRRVDRAEDFAEALESAQAEAASAFGDPAVLIERFVAAPRHIEVQLLADAHGRVLHLNERDCTLQRRHQKVIEEAPAPGTTPELRAEIGAAAVRAAEAIGYVGAGTVEFIADASDGLRADRIWFMEMNTRLQVEHPVTEAVTGLDLVEWQLRIAAGEALPFDQDGVGLDGWAMEARLYAEDPAKGFLPQTGRLSHLALPPETLARSDAGVAAGDAVSPHYDPMIAKLIVHAPTRDAARRRLLAALERTEVGGLVTNLDFLRRLASDPGFAAGEMDTGLIDRALPALTMPEAPPPGAAALAAAASLGLHLPAVGAGPFDRRDGWRPWGRETRRIALDGPDGPVKVALEAAGDGLWHVREGDDPALVLRLGPSGARIGEGDAAAPGHAVLTEGRAEAFLAGRSAAFRLPDPFAAAAETTAGGDAVLAPMPGLVKRLLAAPGDAVSAGQTLAVMEAMKMEHRLTAPRDGVVESASAEQGAQVDEGAVLLTLVPQAEAEAADAAAEAPAPEAGPDVPAPGGPWTAPTRDDAAGA